MLVISSSNFYVHSCGFKWVHCLQFGMMKIVEAPLWRIRNHGSYFIVVLMSCETMEFADLLWPLQIVRIRINSIRTWVYIFCNNYGSKSRCSNLLFISYKFVKGFLAITFLLLTISSWNFHDVCQHFLYNQKRNFIWIRQKMRNFPIDPHYKNRSL